MVHVACYQTSNYDVRIQKKIFILNARYAQITYTYTYIILICVDNYL